MGALLVLALPATALAVVSTRPSPDPAGQGSVAEALAVEPILSAGGVVVSSSAGAARAGARILEEGGNAVDAAVAAAFALTATDPSESGLGGQAWILIQPKGGPPVAFLCPSRAPRRVDVAAVRRARGEGGIAGHAAAAVPTSVASLGRALERHGTMSLAQVLAPAIEEAGRGWTIGWVGRGLVTWNALRIWRSDVLRPRLLRPECGPDGLPLAADVGTRVVLPGLEATLRRLAEAGWRDFYTGKIAAAIDEDMRAHGGFVRTDDLARVPASVVETAPTRSAYRDREVLGIGSPGGGDTLAEALQILGAFPRERVAGYSPDALQLLLDAVRAAREDEPGPGHAASGERGAAAPAQLGRARAAARALEMRPGSAWNPAAIEPPATAVRPDAGHTTHTSVVDAEGNAVSITQTLGTDWGAAAVGERLGFVYNGFLAWFDVDDPADSGYLRPLASLAAPTAPTIVLRDGEVEMVLGSPGSSRITSALVSVLRHVVDGGMSLAEAVSAPRVLWQDELPLRRLVAELAPPVAEETLQGLRDRGYRNVFVLREPGPDLPVFCAVNAIAWNERANAWEGVADPRRGGVSAAADPGRRKLRADAPKAPARTSPPTR